MHNQVAKKHSKLTCIHTIWVVRRIDTLTINPNIAFVFFLNYVPNNFKNPNINVFLTISCVETRIRCLFVGFKLIIKVQIIAWPFRCTISTSYFSSGIMYSIYHFSFLSLWVFSKRNSLTVIPGHGTCTESSQESARDRFVMLLAGGPNWKLLVVLIHETPRHNHTILSTEVLKHHTWTSQTSVMPGKQG